MLIDIPADLSRPGQWLMVLWPIGTAIVGTGLAGMGYALASRPRGDRDRASYRPADLSAAA